MNEGGLLLRQVQPSFVRQGRVTSQAFTPTRKDEGRLSTYDGDQITPKDSWLHYTQNPARVSAGVMSVTVGECRKLGLRVKADRAAFAEHVVICFRRLSSREVKKAAKHLARLAWRRGWSWRPSRGDE